MLILLEAKGEKLKAQRTMEATLKSALSNMGQLNIGFPSGNVDEVIFSNGDGQLWCAFGNGDNYKIPRTWNAFGVFDAARSSQIITVEVNIPTNSNTSQVSGFFAQDPTSGKIFLMHDGGVGGGRKGVGRGAFLAWSKSNLLTVWTASGKERQGIVIGEIESEDFQFRLWRFVRLVGEFKLAVRNDELNAEKLDRIISEWEDFDDVIGGRRQGSRSSDIDYFSYHDDVVRELYRERKADLAEGERIIYNKLIDLFVRKGSDITEMYEVKTKLDTQSIYTGVGQLMTHSVGAAADVKRFLVLPIGSLPGNLESCIAALSITLRRFSVNSANSEPEVALH